jgi:Tol biopolymer transport system component
MPFSPGDKLGPYEILAPIGAGGMGEVYKARDTKLDREVAVKVLPAALAQDPERLTRFEREAKVLASLNHPNIAQIYGIEESNGVRALVMELVPGQTLKGPLPLETALNYAKQIADALEVAHEKAITHRDLKPGNIMVTPAGVVKVLDFGLAAVGQPTGADDGNPTNSPTLTIAATQAGMIMGTAGYMSPEQAAGQTVDRRTDIWAFGVVLWEVLTGKRLFEGASISHILAAVLKDEPDFTQVPLKVRRLLQSCLQKDPKHRLQAIGDWRLLVDETSAQMTAPSTAPIGRLPWIAAGVLAVVAAVGLAGWYRATRPVEKPLMRLSVDLGPNAVEGAAVTTAISPDGTRIVFPMRGADGKQQLATRLLEQTQASLLPGTVGASDSFFSPDGQWIGFFADRKMKKISVLGGAPVTLCDAPSSRGASWGEDGTIVAALNSGEGLSRVPAAGGTPRPFTKLERGELTHRWPQVLPGGKAVLFTSSHANVTYTDATVEALSPQTGVRKTVVTGAYFGRYLPTNGSTGHLIYIHDGTLFAVPFDPDRLELRGAPAPVLEDVDAVINLGAAQFDFSRTGAFIYRNGKARDQGWPVVWLDSSGKTQPLVTKPNGYTSPRFSPDGRLLSLALGAGGAHEFQIFDWQRGTMSRLVLTTEANFYPTWSPDGKHLAFRATTSTGSVIRWTRADGSTEPVSLLETKDIALPYSFSPDGRLTNTVWMTSCTVARVRGSGTRTRRQIGGRIPLNVICNW